MLFCEKKLSAFFPLSSSQVEEEEEGVFQEENETVLEQLFENIERENEGYAKLLNQYIGVLEKKKAVFREKVAALESLEARLQSSKPSVLKILNLKSLSWIDQFSSFLHFTRIIYHLHWKKQKSLVSIAIDRITNQKIGPVFSPDHSVPHNPLDLLTPTSSDQLTISTFSPKSTITPWILASSAGTNQPLDHKNQSGPFGSFKKHEEPFFALNSSFPGQFPELKNTKEDQLIKRENGALEFIGDLKQTHFSFKEEETVGSQTSSECLTLDSLIANALKVHGFTEENTEKNVNLFEVAKLANEKIKEKGLPSQKLKPIDIAKKMRKMKEARTSQIQVHLSNHSNDRVVWTEKEDEALLKAYRLFGDGNWKQMASFVEGKNASQCFQRWFKHLNKEIIKGPWSSYEDSLLLLGILAFRNSKSPFDQLQDQDSLPSLGNWKKTPEKPTSKSKRKQKAALESEEHQNSFEFTGDSHDDFFEGIFLKEPKCLTTRKHLDVDFDFEGPGPARKNSNEGDFTNVSWVRVSELFCGTRTDVQCRERFSNIFSPKIVKGYWSIFDTIRLIKMEKKGRKWSEMAESLGSRTDCQCRRHFLNLSKKKGVLDKRVSNILKKRKKTTEFPVFKIKKT